MQLICTRYNIQNPENCDIQQPFGPRGVRHCNLLQLQCTVKPRHQNQRQHCVQIVQMSVVCCIDSNTAAITQTRYSFYLISLHSTSTIQPCNSYQLWFCRGKACIRIVTISPVMSKSILLQHLPLGKPANLRVFHFPFISYMCLTSSWQKKSYLVTRWQNLQSF
jgi:hypothetical protein